MSEQPTLHDDEPVYDDAVDDAWTDEDPPELPRRPKRRLVTPWTLGLAAVLVAALGFIGGVQVQKGEQDDGAASGLPAGLRAAMAGGAGGARGGAPGAGANAGGTADGASAPTMGEVASKDGSTLYVTDSSGATVKVKTNGNSKVTRTAKGKVSGVHPGDTVVITGSTNANGTVTATQITATASGVSTGGFGGGGTGGGGFPGGGGPPTGAGGATGAPGAPAG